MPNGDLTDQQVQAIRDEVLRARVRELVPESKPRASPLSHPLLLALVSFILTGVVGAVLSGLIQQRAEFAKHAADVRDRRLTAAAQVSDSLAIVLNEGMHLAASYYQASQRHLPALQVWRDSFANFADRFESRDIRDAARICRYYGPRASYEYAFTNRQFRYLGVDLREYEKKAHSDYDSVTMAQFDELVRFERRVYHLLYTLTDDPPGPPPPSWEEVFWGRGLKGQPEVDHSKCGPLR